MKPPRWTQAELDAHNVGLVLDELLLQRQTVTVRELRTEAGVPYQVAHREIASRDHLVRLERLYGCVIEYGRRGATPRNIPHPNAVGSFRRRRTMLALVEAGHTQTEIARKYGISRQRVAQIIGRDP